MYANDNNEMMPVATSAAKPPYDKLLVYLGGADHANLLRCPDDDSNTTIEDVMTTPSYGVRKTVLGQELPAGKTNREQYLLLLDTTGCGLWSMDESQEKSYLLEGADKSRLKAGVVEGKLTHLGRRHNDGVNCAYLDGHVKWRELNELPANMGSFTQTDKAEAEKSVSRAPLKRGETRSIEGGGSVTILPGGDGVIFRHHGSQ